MCGTCGCADGTVAAGTGTGTGAARDPAPAHARAHAAATGRTVRLEQAILTHNGSLARLNRDRLAAHRIVAVTLMSSPGAGETTLLTRTISELGGRRAIGVVEGDQERARTIGAPVVRINSGAGCHLDADMVRRGLDTLAPADGSLVMIENVRDLGCPALFDLGERDRVVIAPVTAGADLPLTCPRLFRAARLVLLTKIDLLPHVDFDVERFTACARRVKPRVQVLPVSATRGDGMADWYDWLDT